MVGDLRAPPGVRSGSGDVARLWLRAGARRGSSSIVAAPAALVRRIGVELAENIAEALGSIRERFQLDSLPADLFAAVQSLGDGEIPPLVRLKLLAWSGLLARQPWILNWLVACLHREERSARLGAIAGLRRLRPPGWDAILFDRISHDTDPDVLGALRSHDSTMP